MVPPPSDGVVGGGPVVLTGLRGAGRSSRTGFDCARQPGSGINPMVWDEKTVYRPVSVKCW